MLTLSLFLPATATAARPVSCPTYERTALAVGWPKKELPRLTYVLARESSCFARAWNKRDPFSGSYGLAQLNGSNKGFFMRENLVRKSMTELFNPKKNLIAALALWKECGWVCWGYKKKGTNEYPRRTTVAHSRIVPEQ